MYNTKKIVITINGVPMQFYGTEVPSMAKSGDVAEAKSGINGDKHFLANNGTWYILTLTLKYNSPNIETLKSLAENHAEFSAMYKDINTGEVYSSNQAGITTIGDHAGDADRAFTIAFL